MARYCLLLALACAGCPSGQVQGTADGGAAPAESPSQPASAAPAPSATPAPSGRAVVHCFGWAHLEHSSTDCYRTRADCESARLKMQEGARMAAECREKQGASCTLVSRPPETPEPFERCFGDPASCARYRDFVGRSGHVTTPCEDL